MQAFVRGRFQRVLVTARQQRDRAFGKIEPGLWIQAPAQDVEAGAGWQPRQGDRRAGRQDVAFAQCATVMRTDPRVQVVAAAAKYRCRGEAAADGQVTATALAHAADAKHAARRQMAGGPPGQRVAVDVGLQRCAGERDHRRPLEAQGRSHQRAFEHGVVFVIARQHVGQAAGGLVQRTGATDAERRQAGPAGVLQAGQQAGLEHADAHAGSGGGTSAGSIASKRTTSPGASRAGGSSCTSNRPSGVRPIKCQPPGSSRG